MLLELDDLLEVLVGVAELLELELELDELDKVLLVDEELLVEDEDEVEEEEVVTIALGSINPASVSCASAVASAFPSKGALSVASASSADVLEEVSSTVTYSVTRFVFRAVLLSGT